MPLPLTYALVLNWNGWPDTLACLESLLRQSDSQLRIVVWDNGSSDDSVERIAAWAEGRLDPLPVLPPSLQPCVRPACSKPLRLQVLRESDTSTPASAKLVVIRGTQNLGYAGGNNAGLRFALAQADCARLWILNNDVVLDTDCLAELQAAAAADPHDRLIGSRIYHMDAPDRLQACGGQRLGFGPLLAPRYVERIQDIDYLVGASIFVSRRRAEELGEFNELYFLNAEDLEYSYPYKRSFVNEHPHVPAFLVAGRVWHRESSTQSRNRYQHTYYYTRNLLYAARKLGRLVAATTFAHALLRAGFAQLRGHSAAARGIRRGMRDYLAGVVGPYRETP